MINFLKNEDGQAVVEFALTLPILLLILCGIIDFGWIFSAQLATDNCAREGARFASVYADYSAAEEVTAEKVENVASGMIKSNIRTFLSYSDPDSPGEGDVSVRVISEVKALTFVAHTLFGGETFYLESVVTMRMG